MCPLFGGWHYYITIVRLKHSTRRHDQLIFTAGAQCFSCASTDQYNPATFCNNFSAQFTTTPRTNKQKAVLLDWVKLETLGKNMVRKMDEQWPREQLNEVRQRVPISTAFLRSCHAFCFKHKVLRALTDLKIHMG